MKEVSTLFLTFLLFAEVLYCHTRAMETWNRHLEGRKKREERQERDSKKVRNHQEAWVSIADRLLVWCSWSAESRSWFLQQQQEKPWTPKGKEARLWLHEDAITNWKGERRDRRTWRSWKFTENCSICCSSCSFSWTSCCGGNVIRSIPFCSPCWAMTRSC